MWGILFLYRRDRPAEVKESLHLLLVAEDSLKVRGLFGFFFHPEQGSDEAHSA